jgi:hypothetical protein
VKVLATVLLGALGGAALGSLGGFFIGGPVGATIGGLAGLAIGGALGATYQPYYYGYAIPYLQPYYVYPRVYTYLPVAYYWPAWPVFPYW